MICEGFQFILRNQANALLRLGVTPHFKVSFYLNLEVFFSRIRTSCRNRLSRTVSVPGPGVAAAVETLPAEESTGVHQRPGEELQV